ncbi:MAG TPA: 4Fe-4S binding protein [Firmicutes bacterium]|nr:4Fe-4S binding protein [Bacillota bacterium]
MVAKIDPELCDRSPFCPAMQMCPAQAIAPQNAVLPWGSPMTVDPEKCTGCTQCARICPHGAITMVPREEEAAAAGQA